MALSVGIQKTLTANTLYNAEPLYGGIAQSLARLEVFGGTVNVWGSDTLPGSPPTNMSKSATGTGFSGIDLFGSIPNYLYIETASGSPTIVSTGIKATTPAV